MALVAVISCEKNIIEENKATITVTPSEVNFGLEGGKDYLTLTLNSETKQWTLVQKSEDVELLLL